MKYDFELRMDERNSLSLIAKQVEENSIVLEFGPANGRLTRYLKEKKNCKIYAVEIDEDAAKDAGRFTEQIIIGDIEEFSWLENWSNIEFDYILFADVLEHLHDPLEVLKQTKCILKDSGKVIISVPNVAHNAILIDLYRNIFNYTNVGLLDNTHIHLFAYYSLKEFCKYAGYIPVIEDAVYGNVGEIEIRNDYSDVNRVVERVLKGRKYGNVYQFLFTLQKNEYVSTNSVVSDYRINPVNAGYQLDVYIDRGAGWSEENKISVTTDGIGHKAYEFKLSNVDEIKGIRVDPLDRNCVVKNIDIKLVDNDGQLIEMFEVGSTGYKYGDMYIFDNDDSQNWYHPNIVSENIISIRIELNYLYVNMDGDFLTEITSLIKSNEEKIVKYQEEIVKFQEEIQRINNRKIFKRTKKILKKVFG